jgi:hypothetical protein
MTHYISYICDQCGTSSDEMPIRDVTLKIPSFLLGSYDFCSVECFEKFFKDKLKGIHKNEGEL